MWQRSTLYSIRREHVFARPLALNDIPVSPSLFAILHATVRSIIKTNQRTLEVRHQNIVCQLLSEARKVHSPLVQVATAWSS